MKPQGKQRIRKYSSTFVVKTSCRFSLCDQATALGAKKVQVS